MHSDLVRGIELAVAAAVATLTDDEIRQLTVEPYMDLRAEAAASRAA